ncbi:M20/M25/M40 family metallo-hydrolase [Rhodocytophaga rosea]|uniref:Carboxypeptidase Q n=1 Tax=Rhodocytophaga rosea TaxID=2704465 RepID=A0A6C0GIB3_9BACT|nr:M20/M25/M40 family metallo-hydrolase [Rhodocytophaga rosea]QHT67422.1 M20/M25/M40 family metallo-hydrolase [Rhodocytophaga rosea]
MKKLYVSTFIFIGFSFLSAYRKANDDVGAVFKRINGEVLQSSNAYLTLQKATSTIGHRLTGSANGEKAEEFTFNEFKSYGFTNVKYQPFEVEAWSRDTVSLEIVPRSSDNFKQVKVVSLAHSPVNASLKGLIIDVGNGLESDFEKVKDAVKGKIALMNIGISPPNKELKNLHRSEKTALAIKYGATGVIIINQVKGGVLLTGTASVTGQLISIPAVCISLEDGEMIRHWMQEEKKLEAHIAMRNKSAMIKARNVIATLKGSGLAKEKIIIGGHLDSWDLATGAIDNGIGSFAVLEIARVFKALNLKPKRTIEFVMFMGEEQGLLGSKAMLDKMVKNKSINRVRYMANLDMSGNPIGFNVSGREEMVSLFTEIGRQIQQIDTAFKNTVNNRVGLHSDHQGFLLEGVPVMAPVSNLDPSIYQCYHADCDDFKLVNKAHLDNTVRFTAMMLYALANASEIPAKRMTHEQTRDFLIKQGLKQELVIAGNWKWKE